MADSTGDNQNPDAFSWRDPHPIFVIFLAGPDEIPFGIQRDFLCAHSAYYRAYFSQPKEDGQKEGDGNGGKENKVEHVIPLHDIKPEVFGLVQNFLYTGRLISDGEALPGYDTLIATWKTGNTFEITSLCDKVIEALVECRRVTQSIPATPLLVQAWKDTPEGSKLRQLLLSWAAEYIRSSESRAEFSKSLPQEVLSELVVAMSHLNSAPATQVDSAPSSGGQTRHKNVHYLEAADSEPEALSKAPKKNNSDVASKRHSLGDFRNGTPKPSAKASRPVLKITKARKPSTSLGGDQDFSTEQKLAFCADFLNRMLSGPGFWTRLVGPFREPVDPVADDVPDYLEKITKPMDLSTIQAKMERGEYSHEDEFAADVRQIFTNCYSYWGEGTPMYAACEKFEERFETGYAGMRKWLAKSGGDESAT